MNPLELARNLEEKYRRYLGTTFYFKDAEFRTLFRDSLTEGRLAKGPYVESTPVFKQRQTAKEVIEDLLGDPIDPGFAMSLGAARRLYSHQQEAIVRTFGGRNIVVATGTGSGKTEAFLFPILLSLYRESLAAPIQPGVRALILYPMNALANDQRDRLGEICESLQKLQSLFSFTFGQYIGDTPEDEQDRWRGAQRRKRDRLPGELVFRSEMRRSPPQILLTNYSMLEYLLVRPDDSPLFDEGNSKSWQYIVLDEAHQYRGSRGIEMAMLIRRLKHRVRAGGRSLPFTCIATSASLMGDETDKKSVADFASELFGEPFGRDDVILGVTEVMRHQPAMTEIDPRKYTALSERIENIKESTHQTINSGLDDTRASADSTELRSIFEELDGDRRALLIRKLTSEGPVEIGDLATAIFPELDPIDGASQVVSLINILIRTRDPQSGVPLMTARYHLFLRSLEGAFISYWPTKAVFLDRVGKIGDGALFEVALCRQCGQHYLVGKPLNGKLTEAVRDHGDPDFGALFFRPVDSEAANVSSIERRTESNLWTLCVECGSIAREGGATPCIHANRMLVEQQEPSDASEDQVPKCGACNYQAPDPVREVVYGTDGPHAVVATSLYRDLPEGRQKILAFADGRQEAAFFAWYLQDSYESILARNLLLHSIQRLSAHTNQGLSLQELASDLLTQLRARGAVPISSGDLDVRRRAWLILYRELLTDEPRISLDGLGLAKWFLQWPPWFSLPRVLLGPPWSLSEVEAADLMQLLMNSVREDAAVELRPEGGVTFQWSDLVIQSRQMNVRIGEPKGDKSIRAWDGKMGKRARLLEKILVRSGFAKSDATQEATKTLRTIWETLSQADSSQMSSDRILLNFRDERRLNPDWLRTKSVESANLLYSCNTCGNIQHFWVRGVCARAGCVGTVDRASPERLNENHYRTLYLDDLPGALRVEEHTAQLDKETAREFQQEFKDGKINILSCSTTFELGVDLGDLDTVFLRNVPPEAFNYAQRVGRSGRRSGRAGFAVTYCRRRPHDLYYYSHPERMLAGRVRSTPLSIRNDRIIARHMSALTLSSYFHANSHRFKTVKEFFVDLLVPTALDDVRNHLLANLAKLTTDLKSIVPTETYTKVGLADGSWIERLIGSDSALSRAQIEVSDDYRKVSQLEKDASQAGDYDRAKWAQGRATQIAGEDILSFLSRKVVIPKYGFPVDVVELDTQRNQRTVESTKVSLERDLSMAIAEFAPTSKLVANKKLWTSHGLKRLAEKEWPRRAYERCSRHNVFRQWREGDEPALLDPCCDSMIRAHYVIPIFGFTTNTDRPKDPKSRSGRVFTTRPYFAGEAGPSRGALMIPASSPCLELTRMTPGNLVVLCEGRRGQGFFVCQGCGAGFDSPKHPHTTAYGQKCDRMLDRVSLGHEFVTDVVQIKFLVSPPTLIEPIWFAHSLASALVEGAAEILEVPSSDLSATIRHDEKGGAPPIILYDNVPGGAGLVARLETESILRLAIEHARARVNGSCKCEENASCYGCIRSYRNQFSHRYLQRGPVHDYLSAILSGWQGRDLQATVLSATETIDNWDSWSGSPYR